MTAHPFAPAPPRLVEDGQQHLGRFGGPIGRTNLLDAPFRGLPRFLRRWRLKEWEALQVATPALFLNVALFDAKIMQLLQAKIYDRARGEKFVHEWKLRPGAFRIADQLLDSDNSYRDRRGHLTFRNRMARGRLEVELELAAHGERPRVAGHLTVHCDRGAAQVVSMPFAHGGMYSHKGMFPVEGELDIGGTRHTISATEARALLDDHKGYYPYVMRWDWVTSAVVEGGIARGFNLTRNQCTDPDQHNENCAWIDDRVGRLPAVEFTRTRAGAPGEFWHVRDREGRVDVRFEPTVPGDVRVNAGIIDSRYRGPFGRFDGRVEPEGLEPIVIDGWFGMGEDFYLRC
jgi:hypothetical protein